MKLTWPLFLFLSLFMCVVTVVSCGGTNCADPANASSVRCTVVDATVTCGGSAFDALVTEQGPGLEQAIGSAVLGDGTIDYNKVEPTLVDYAVRFGACFVAEVFGKMQAIHLAAAPDGSGAPHASPKSLADTFQKFRAAHYLGKKFSTSSGPL